MNILSSYVNSKQGFCRLFLQSLNELFYLVLAIPLLFFSLNK